MEYLCIGDSHCRDYFNHIKKLNSKFKVCGVSGGTAYGLKNINSISKCKQKLLTFLENISQNTKLVIILIGEGDCGYLIYRNSERLNISIDKSLNLSIQYLFEFIEEILNITPYLKNKICIMGVTLPSITLTDKGQIIEEREKITKKYSREILTENTLKFNNIIREKCIVLGYKYFDITKYIINNETKLLQDRFKLPAEKNDHHLNPVLIYNFILDEINKL